jgi:hypothetical protein
MEYGISGRASKALAKGAIFLKLGRLRLSSKYACFYTCQFSDAQYNIRRTSQQSCQDNR